MWEVSYVRNETTLKFPDFRKFGHLLSRVEVPMGLGIWCSPVFSCCIVMKKKVFVGWIQIPSLPNPPQHRPTRINNHRVRALGDHFGPEIWDNQVPKLRKRKTPRKELSFAKKINAIAFLSSENELIKDEQRNRPPTSSYWQPHYQQGWDSEIRTLPRNFKSL